MMNFHIGKIYNMPTNFYFYKSNQSRLWMEYCKKVKIPEKVKDSSYIEYLQIFPELDEDKSSISNSDDDSWIDIKKYL
jgi:hypothetical protein